MLVVLIPEGHPGQVLGGEGHLQGRVDHQVLQQEEQEQEEEKTFFKEQEKEEEEDEEQEEEEDLLGLGGDGGPGHGGAPGGGVPRPGEVRPHLQHVPAQLGVRDGAGERASPQPLLE